LGVGVALGFAAGLASFTVVAVVLAAAESHAIAVALGVLLVAVVIAAARSFLRGPTTTSTPRARWSPRCGDLGFRSSVGAPRRLPTSPSTHAPITPWSQPTSRTAR
jgi:hypothetical protein